MEITSELVSVVPLDSGCDSNNLYGEIYYSVKDDVNSEYPQSQFASVDGLEHTTDGSLNIVYEQEIHTAFDAVIKNDGNVKTELTDDDCENVITESGATDDESMAVEALRQLGSSAIYTSINSQPRIETKTPKDLPLLPCSHCNLQFRTTADLQYHSSVCRHNQLLCQICKKAFDRKIDLNNHLVCHAVERPHSCRICGTLFLHKKDLLKHLPLHQDGINMNQCSVCGVTFNRPSSLTNHMKIHNYLPGREMTKTESIEMQSNLCPVDNGETSSSANGAVENNNTTKIVLPSISHIGNLSNWELTYDTIQTEPYNAYVNLEVGQEMTIGTFEEDKVNLVSINYNCNADDQNNFQKNEEVEPVTSHKADITNEMNDLTQIRNNKKPHNCKYCNKTFAREKALMSHVKLHSNILDNFLQCDTCDRCFEDENTLDKHLAQCNRRIKDIILNNDTQEPADKVPISTDSNNDTQNSIRNNMEDNSKSQFYKHACLVCEKRFSTKQKLYRHMWIHRKKTFVCETCASTFEKQEDLDLHRLSLHQGCSAYICSECGKSFSSRQGLWEHNRMHGTASNLYKCTECSKTFSSRQGYLIHKRTHNDERPYGCRYCLKSFRDGGTLRKHERIHTGERPHACPLCARTFNQKVVLREHVRWLHTANREPNEDGQFNCLLCEQVVSDKDDLCAHIVKHSDQLALLAKNASSNNVIISGGKKGGSVVSNKQNDGGNIKVKSEIVPSSTISDKSTVRLIQNAQDGYIECDICSTAFLSKDDLLDHVRIHI